MKPLMEVIAAIPETQMNAFIRLLMAACAVQYTGQTSKELKALAVQSKEGARKTERVLGTDLTPFLTDVINGKEVDDVAIIRATKELRTAVREELKTDRNIGHFVLEALNATTRYLVNHGEPAIKRIKTLVAEMADPTLSAQFVTDAGSQRDFVKPLERIVKAVTGRKGSLLTQEESNALKAKKPEMHREYLRLRRGFNEVWKEELRNLVATSGKKVIPYQDVLKYFRTKKIEAPMQEAFKGFIDGNGKVYTVAGKLLPGLPQTGFSVRMNPEYDPRADNTYVFTTVNDTTGDLSQYVYTVDYRKQKNAEKFVKVDKLRGAIEGIHKKWVAHLRKNDTSGPCVASAVLQMLYTTRARIGTMGNATKGENTYGIVTLEARHVKVQGNKLIVAYSGKDGVPHKFVIDGSSGPDVAALVKQVALLREGKGPRDRLFTFTGKRGNPIPVTGNQVNKWFVKLGAPQGTTVHKIRHLKGTELFMKLLEEHKAKIFDRKIPLSQAEADKMLNLLALKVGQMLGHMRGVGSNEKPTGATAIKNYIDPGVMMAYYDQLNLRQPKFLAKLK